MTKLFCPCCRRDFRSDKAYREYLAFKARTAQLRQEVAQMREPSLTKREIHMKDSSQFKSRGELHVEH